MEVECEMESPEDESLITLWIQENNTAVKRWKDIETTGDIQALKQKFVECDAELSPLLQKIKGLPPTANSLPLELTVLYNTLLIHINITGGFVCEHQELLRNVLCRVLETRHQREVKDTTITELWKEVLSAVYPQETYSALNRLAGLQCGLWLVENQLEPIVNLFYLLNQDPQVAASSYRKNNLLELIKEWKVSLQAEEEIHTLQNARHVKDILYTSVAFLQGLISMDAEDFPQAINFLQDAASSLSTSKILAEIYTCLGFSFYKMAKPQTALQFWKQALIVNVHCLPALYHTSRLYSDMNRIESEQEALALLYIELENHCVDPNYIKTLFLFRTELLLSTSLLSRYVHVPNSWEVKYLLANHCLKRNSAEQAAEHYMDLMTALPNESQPELHPSPAPLPRIPVIYLEASTALLETGRFQDAITVNEEVLENLSHITAAITTVLKKETNEETKSYIEELNCVLWASTAHFLQGEAQGKLRNHKESITAYTRCIHLMMKVQFPDSGPINANDDHIKDHHIFTVLKASAFLGRSQQFFQMGDTKNSLMNVRLALQAMQDFPGTLFCIIGLLWKTDLKKEVALKFKSWGCQGKMECVLDQYKEIKRNLPLYLVVSIQKRFLLDKSLVQELETFLQKEEKNTF